MGNATRSSPREKPPLVESSALVELSPRVTPLVIQENDARLSRPSGCLPGDVWVIILGYLNPTDYPSVQRVCTNWRVRVQKFHQSSGCLLRGTSRPLEIASGKLLQILGFTSNGHLCLVYSTPDRPFVLGIYDRKFAMLRSQELWGLETDSISRWAVVGGAVSVDSEEVLIIVTRSLSSTANTVSRAYYAAIYSLYGVPACPTVKTCCTRQSTIYTSPAVGTFLSSQLAVFSLQEGKIYIQTRRLGVDLGPFTAFSAGAHLSLVSLKSPTRFAVIGTSRSISFVHFQIWSGNGIEREAPQQLPLCIVHKSSLLVACHNSLLCFVRPRSLLLLPRKGPTIEQPFDDAAETENCIFARDDGLIVVGWGNRATIFHSAPP